MPEGEPESEPRVRRRKRGGCFTIILAGLVVITLALMLYVGRDWDIGQHRSYHYQQQ